MERKTELLGGKKTDGLKGIVIWDAIKKKDLQRNVSHLFECICVLSHVDRSLSLCLGSRWAEITNLLFATNKSHPILEKIVYFVRAAKSFN